MGIAVSRLPSSKLPGHELLHGIFHSNATQSKEVHYQAPLATLNLKDYEDFTEYHGLPILGAQ